MYLLCAANGVINDDDCRPISIDNMPRAVLRLPSADRLISAWTYRSRCNISNTTIRALEH